MPRKAPPPPTTGVGELRYQGFAGPVEYQVAGDPASLTARSPAMRGQFTADAAIAEAAFRAGSGYLVLEDGKTRRLTLLGYTAGSDTAYFEINP
jgi:hypothetical protein